MFLILALTLVISALVGFLLHFYLAQRVTKERMNTLRRGPGELPSTRTLEDLAWRPRAMGFQRETALVWLGLFTWVGCLVLRDLLLR